LRYEGAIYRPPSEAGSLILQATVGCSHNKCTYCAMYRGKSFRVRDVDEVMADIDEARAAGPRFDKVFVADGDSLVMPTAHWEPILEHLRATAGPLRRVSCYASSRNVLEKSPAELRRLRELGLELLYLGPESGDPLTLKRIVKGDTREQHVEAAHRAHEAGMRISAIFLLGAGGVARSAEHAAASASLITEMDPEFVSALVVTVIPGTPLARAEHKGHWELPDLNGLLTEIKTIASEARPTDALFRTNHASNYLPLAGRLPKDAPRIAAVLEAAMRGEVPLRPEWARGL
jgi:radical SAM superfamily enzyme YgiQ (UPF0313 family)